MATISPFARPLYVMLKPVGAACNLACDYCYYLEKSNLYKQQSHRIMTDELLERFIKEYIEAQTMNEVLFTWHGGEPTLRPLSFYQKAVALQQKYARGRRIDNALQTNGTLLTDEWCRFLKANNWLVGISIDGPAEFHDRYRRDNRGKPSFEKVMNGIRLLQKHGVEWNAMAVVNRYNADHPKAFYDFFKRINCQFIQFAPIVERIMPHDDGRHLAALGEAAGEMVSDTSVTPEQWGTFLCGIFDEWKKADIGKVFVQIFDSMLANWVGVMPGTCIFSKECGHAGVMEYNGDVYSCDHFVFPQYKLGNIYQHTLLEMLYGEKQRYFSQLKYNRLPRQCKECRWAFACHGECPKNRFLKDRYGNPGLNYLCAGYRRFFEHIAPTMEEMKKPFMTR
jgi:anaerobic sulfatase maturase